MSAPVTGLEGCIITKTLALRIAGPVCANLARGGLHLAH